MKKESYIINISLGTILKITLFLILLYLLLFFKTLVLSILTAVVLASAVEPAIIRLEKMKIPRVFSATIVYVLLLIFMLVVLFYLIPILLTQAVNIYKTIPQQISVLESSFQSLIVQYPIFEKIMVLLKNKIQEDPFSMGGNALTGAIINIFGGVFNFVLIFVISFYLAVQSHGIEIFIRLITPPKYTKYAINLWKRGQRKIGLWMQGQILLGFLIGSLTYLGLMVFFGFKESMLLALIAAVSELIPVVGPFVAALPAVGVAFTNGGISLVWGVVVFYFIIQMIENNLIYPLVVKKVVGVPSLLVIIALIVGFQLFGFLGVVLAVPVSAVLMEYIKDVEKKQREAIKRGEEKEVHLAKKS